MWVHGSHLRRLLGHGMANSPLACSAGIGVTALVQSSNATALLAISFVAQGLMALPTALAIMLGADVGTALMARVLTLDLSWLSPLLALIDVCMFLSRKQTRAGQLGKVQNIKTSRRRSFSDTGLDELSQLHGLLSTNLALGLSVFLAGDSHNARQLLQQKRQFRKRERELAYVHVHRLHQRVVESIETSAAHLELIADMKRLNSLSAARPMRRWRARAARATPSRRAATGCR